MGLMLHRGAQLVNIEDLQKVELPEVTKSYKPVAHSDLAMNLAKIGQDILKEYTLQKSQYGLSRNGLRMFGVHTFKNGSDTVGLSIGFRNSYDKSMSVGIAIGASVFVCDNLALTGEVAVMRKHTTNVLEDLEEMAITTIYRSQNNFINILKDSANMKTVPYKNEDAYKMIGLLYGNKVLSPRQLPVVKKEWLKPTYPEFEPRNKWSFYNSCTHALKSCDPLQIMEKHIKLHNILAN